MKKKEKSSNLPKDIQLISSRGIIWTQRWGGEWSYHFQGLWVHLSWGIFFSLLALTFLTSLCADKQMGDAKDKPAPLISIATFKYYCSQFVRGVTTFCGLLRGWPNVGVLFTIAFDESQRVMHYSWTSDVKKVLLGNFCSLAPPIQDWNKYQRIMKYTAQPELSNCELMPRAPKRKVGRVAFNSASCHVCKKKKRKKNWAYW